jgi:hypothetical protein
MENQDIRRSRLKQWIADNFAGNVSQFAKFVKKRQPQIADMLDGRKAFGEKVARSLEKLAGMPPNYLDDTYRAMEVREPTSLYHGILITRAGARVGAEWDRLDVADRIEMEQEIARRVGKKIRDQRPPGNRPEKKTD